jgi:hypothetical protein
MSLIYIPEPDALKAQDRAFTQDEAKLAIRDESSRLKWMLTATDVGYSPYVVKIHSMSGPNDPSAKVSFIDCRTGEDLGDPLTIDMTDRTLVWNRLPSTLEGWSEGATDCAFLFFSPKIHDLTPKAVGSRGGDGKWPRAASLLTAHDQIRSLVRDLIDANPGAIGHLDHEKQRRLKHLAGARES